MNIRPDEIDWSKPRRQIAEETGVSVQRIGQIWRILQGNTKLTDEATSSV